LDHFPWYSAAAQARRAAATKQAHRDALAIGASVERVLDDYKRAEARRKP